MGNLSAVARLSSVDKLYGMAVDEHRLMQEQFRSAKEHAINTGYYLALAKEGIGHGDWLDYLEQHESEIKVRTAQAYLKFFDLAISWAKAELNGTNATVDQLLQTAKGLVLQSPRPFTELLRHAGEMRKFGEYDALKYKASKARIADQIEFSFAFEEAVEQLVALKRDGRVADLASSSLLKLETELEESLDHVRNLLAGKAASL